MNKKRTSERPLFFQAIVFIESQKNILRFQAEFYPHPLNVTGHSLFSYGEQDVRDFSEEIRAFKARRSEESVQAGQLAAFRLATGTDLDAALSANRTDRQTIVARLRRLIERERLKGARRHWSYDLNRHIALKQALDRLTLPSEEQ